MQTDKTRTAFEMLFLKIHLNKYQKPTEAAITITRGQVRTLGDKLFICLEKTKRSGKTAKRIGKNKCGLIFGRIFAGDKIG